MELSPAAAAASSLIRSGVSLTSIYREHCRVVAELEEAKAENKRIENYFHELVEVSLGDMHFQTNCLVLRFASYLFAQAINYILIGF